MGEYRRIHSPPEGQFKLLQRILLIEQLAAGHMHIDSQCMERPGHRIMLKAGYHHPAPGFYQGADGHIQAMGAAGGANHLLRFTAKQLPCPFPAAQHCACPTHGSLITAPAGIAAVFHGAHHRIGHAWRLGKGCGTVVKIGHTNTSSGVPSRIR